MTTHLGKPGTVAEPITDAASVPTAAATGAAPVTASPDGPEQVFRARRLRRVILLVVLAGAVAVTSVISIMLGQYDLPLRDLPGILAAGPTGATDLTESVVWQIRIPRVLLGLLVGAALGVGGALMQAVFANPLAEPSVIGVTSGAGVGAAAAIVFGWTFLGTSTTPALAFVSGLFTTGVVYALSRFGGKIRVINLILVGIAVNAVAGAAISFLVFLAPSTSREEIVFWQMGTLNGAQWAHVSVVGVIVAVGLVIALLLGRHLDVLSLGDRAAAHVGVNVGKLRALAIITATLLTAAAVSYAGLIGFVGLIVPHIIRTVAGPSNHLILPASALGGAVLIGLSDIVARTIIPFVDLPIGIFTALVGGPVFFILLRRMTRKGGHA